MYYRKIHRVHSKSRFNVKERASLKSKLKRTGRGGRGVNSLKQTYIEGEWGPCKTNRNKQWGTWFKNWKFWANILFEWPYTPHKWVIPNFDFSNIWWNAIKVWGNLPVKNNLILVSSLILVKKYVNLHRFFQ